ncbi:MAG: class I SAM-dependent methyltransferase [Candidatus Buchananbacteria bacterium]|nr:class I SAM-dependent methyltransferase [Candidatus Buchananbacteria bacterium]
MAGNFFIFWLVLIGFLVVILGSFAFAGILAAPWVPLWKKDVRRMLELAGVKEGETVFDLGAGDGRIVIMAAKEFGAKSVGFEIAFLPYFLAYIKIILSGKKKNINLRFKNFYHQDFSQADVICTFLSPQAMLKLKPKLQTETKPGCRIISYVFKIPDWQPTKIDKPNQNQAAIYLYQR